MVRLALFLIAAIWKRNLVKIGILFLVSGLLNWSQVSEPGYGEFYYPLGWDSARILRENFGKIGQCPKLNERLVINLPDFMASVTTTSTNLEHWENVLGKAPCEKIIAGDKKSHIWELPLLLDIGFVEMIFDKDGTLVSYHFYK